MYYSLLMFLNIFWQSPGEEEEEKLKIWNERSISENDYTFCSGRNIIISGDDFKTWVNWNNFFEGQIGKMKPKP